MPLSTRRVTDPDSLKALAHPLRLSLLAALVSQGPMTATQLAGLLEESPSNCSWHLRRLAERGFVREARGGTGRNRPWQAVSEGLEWGDDEPVEPPESGAPHPDGGRPRAADASDQARRMAADALTDMVVDREVQRLRAARAARHHETPAWRGATAMVQAQAWMTPAEAGEIKDELTALLMRHMDRSRHPEARPDGARLVSLVGWLVPSGPEPQRAVTPAAEPGQERVGAPARET